MPGLGSDASAVIRDLETPCSAPRLDCATTVPEWGCATRCPLTRAPVAPIGGCPRGSESDPWKCERCALVPQQILPGFRWLTLGSFLLGLGETFMYGLYAGLVFTVIHNTVLRRVQ